MDAKTKAAMKEAREELRAAFTKYEGLLEEAFNDTKRGSDEADDLHASLTQIDSARRVMWMD